MTSTTPELLYFNARGRAELARLIFAEAQVPYTDTRFRDGQSGIKDFCDLKHQGILPFDQVPVLKIDGIILAQSCAMAQYLARKYDLIGSTPQEAALAEMTVLGCADLRQRFATAIAADNIASDSAKTRQEGGHGLPEDFTQKVLPRWCEHFERLMKGNEGSEYIVGKRFTYADLAVFDCMEFFTDVVEDMSQRYPLLFGLVKRVSERENVAKWLRERPMTSV